MTVKIPGLEDSQLLEIQSFFPDDIEYVIFGSRSKGTHRENSDLDICIKSTIERYRVAEIEEKLEQSDLPFTFDLILYTDCNKDFRALIDAEGITLGQTSALR